jgi:serine/threonine-protein kinase HipA
MRVGENAADSTLSNALSMCSQFALEPAAARQEIHKVIAAVAHWREHFSSVGVTRGDIELLGEHIDRPFLREQRQAFAR